MTPRPFSRVAPSESSRLEDFHYEGNSPYLAAIQAKHVRLFSCPCPELYDLDRAVLLETSRVGIATLSRGLQS